MEIYLFGSDQKLLEDGVLMPTNVISSWQKQTLGGMVSHTVEALYSPNLDTCAYFGMRDVDDSSIFWMYRIQNREKNGKVIRLDGIHKFFDDLATRGYIEDIRPKNKGISSTMHYILDGTGWEIGSNSVIKKSGTNIYYLTKIEAFNKVIAAWGCEYRLRMQFVDGKIVSQQVDLAPAFTEDNGIAYEYGDKLVSVVAQSNENAVFTAICGRGKGEEAFDENGNSTGGYGRKISFKDIEWKRSKGDPIDKPLGQGYIELPQATREIGFPDGKPRIGLVDFPDIEDKEELLKATYEVLLSSCRPKVEMKASVYDDESRHLGEKVWIIRNDLGIRYQTRIFEISRSFLSDKKKEISFGDKIVMSRAEQRIKADAEEAIKQDETLSYMDKITDRLQKILFNNDGYNYELKAGNDYKLPAGYYSFDRPIDQNPTKVIYVGAGHLAIANSKKSDGTWNFRTFGTGDGFTADLIRAGMLQGGGVKWNLETGYLNIGDKLIYDPSTGELHLAQGSVTINALDEDTKSKINQAIELSGAITDTVTEYAMGGCGSAAPMDGWSEDALLTMADKNDGVNLPYNGDVALITMRQEKMRAIKKDGSFSDSSFSLSELLPDRFYVYVDQLPETLSGFESSIPTYYTGSSSPVETLKRFYIEHYTDGGFQRLFKTGCLWKRTVYKCSDGTVKYSPAERVGKDGKRAYVHIAYADDDKGGGFSFDDADKAYMGQYTDQEEETSTDATRYKWTRIRGKDGTIGKDGTNGRGVKTVITQYATVYGDETPSGASWTDTPPSYWSEYAKVWQRLKITYTDGSVDTTVPEKFNDEALKSLKEKMNTIESGYTEIKDGQADFVTKSALGAVGETSINGFNVTTGAIRSQTGDTYIDLNGSNFTFGGGAMTYSPSDGLKIGRGKYYSTTDDKAWSIWERSDYYGDKKIGGYRPITMSTNDTYGMNLYASKGMRLCLGVEKDDQNHYTNPIEITNETADGEMWCKGYLMFGPEAKFGFDYNDKRAKLGAFYDFDRTRWKMMHCAYFGSPIDFYEDLDMHNYTIRNQSDIRLKNVISGWEVKALDEISAMEFIKFRWKDRPEQEKQIDTEKVHYGISAQSAPFVAVAGEDGYLNIDMTRMTYVNAKAVQELNGKVKQLEEQNKGLQMRIKRLEEAIHDIIGRS